jgi:hypothetical protein
VDIAIINDCFFKKTLFFKGIFLMCCMFGCLSMRPLDQMACASERSADTEQSALGAAVSAAFLWRRDHLSLW